MSLGSLPGEIRNQIWNYLIVSPTTDHRLALVGQKNEVHCQIPDTPLHVACMYEADPPYRRFSLSPNLLLISKQFYSEIAPILYGRHIFEFNHSLRVVNAFLECLRPSTRALLRTIWIQDIKLSISEHLRLFEPWEEICETLNTPLTLDHAICVMISFNNNEMGQFNWHEEPISTSSFLRRELKQLMGVRGVECIKIVEMETRPCRFWEKLMAKSDHFRHWLGEQEEWLLEEGVVRDLDGPHPCLKISNFKGEDTSSGD